MRPPRLIHVTTVALSLHRMFAGQIEYMQALGLEVMGVCSPGDFVDQARTRHGIEIFTVPMTRSISPLRDLSAIWQLIRLFRKLQPDIVHVHTPKAGLLGAIAAFIARTPVRIYTIRGCRWETLDGLKRGILLACEALACKCSTAIICNSGSLRELVLKAGVAPARKLTILSKGSGNGVNVERVQLTSEARRRADEIRRELGIPDGAPVIGYVGRVVKEKGIVELYTAWQTIREAFPSSHLMLIGPPEAEDAVPESVLEGLKSDPRVHFTGDRPDIVPFYAAMSVLVLPTYREGFPNTLLEAAAMTLPAVATRTTGCVDAVADGVTGLLVEPRDAAGLARAILQILSDPERSAAMGRAAREMVTRDFNQPVIWGELYSLYARLLHEKGTRTLAPQQARPLC